MNKYSTDLLKAIDSAAAARVASSLHPIPKGGEVTRSVSQWQPLGCVLRLLDDGPNLSRCMADRRGAQVNISVYFEQSDEKGRIQGLIGADFSVVLDGRHVVQRVIDGVKDREASFSIDLPSEFAAKESLAIDVLFGQQHIYSGYLRDALIDVDAVVLEKRREREAAQARVRAAKKAPVKSKAPTKPKPKPNPKPAVAPEKSVVQHAAIKKKVTQTSTPIRASIVRVDPDGSIIGWAKPKEGNAKTELSLSARVADEEIEVTTEGLWADGKLKRFSFGRLPKDQTWRRVEVFFGYGKRAARSPIWASRIDKYGVLLAAPKTSLFMRSFTLIGFHRRVQCFKSLRVKNGDTVRDFPINSADLKSHSFFEGHNRVKVPILTPLRNVYAVDEDGEEVGPLPHFDTVFKTRWL